MKTLAINIAAFDCVEFLPGLINCLRSQYQTPGWDYDIRIGVDCCGKTSDALIKMGVSHYLSTRNVGHLIMRNALMYLRFAHAHSYFDADDVMMPAYLKRNLEALENHKFVMAAKYNTRMNLIPRGEPVVENGGAMTFTHEVLEAVGGFPPYRCAGDTDLMRRAEMAGFTIHQMTGEALYYRRGHDKCLTKAISTRIGSDYRKKSWLKMTRDRERGIIKIKPEVVELGEVV